MYGWRCAVGRVSRAEEFARWWWGSVHEKGVKGKRYFFVACIRIIIYYACCLVCNVAGAALGGKQKSTPKRRYNAPDPPSGPPRDRRPLDSAHKRARVDVWVATARRPNAARAPANRACTSLGGGCLLLGDRWGEGELREIDVCSASPGGGPGQWQRIKHGRRRARACPCE